MDCCKLSCMPSRCLTVLALSVILQPAGVLPRTAGGEYDQWDESERLYTFVPFIQVGQTGFSGFCHNYKYLWGA